MGARSGQPLERCRGRRIAAKRASGPWKFLVALPFELSQPQRVGLVKGFSQELSDRYGFAVDVAIHAPRDFPESDPRNVHAHLLTTTREVAIEGLGAKTTLDMNDGNRRQMGLGPVISELLHARERWAAAANQAMLEASIAARVDHRSLESQGIDQEPRPRIPRAAFEMERHGYRSVVAERIRDEHHARVQARLDKAAEPAKSSVLEPTTGVAAARPQSAEEVQREAVENWSCDTGKAAPLSLRMPRTLSANRSRAGCDTGKVAVRTRPRASLIPTAHQRKAARAMMISVSKY